jgi:hypothetical protein
MIPVTVPDREACRRRFARRALRRGYHAQDEVDGVAARIAVSGVRRRERTARALLVALLGAACSGGAESGGLDRTASRAEPGGAPRTNIVWIVADSIEEASDVPSLRGARTVVAELPAGVSDPASVRAILLTGASPAALGIDPATGRLTAPPPAGVAVLPAQLRRAGYYTSRAGARRHRLAAGRGGTVDIVHVDGGVHEAARALPVAVEELAQPGLLGAWDAAGPDVDWRGREKDWESPCTVAFGCGGARNSGPRPFFAQFNLDADGASEGESREARVAGILGKLAAEDLLESTAVFLVAANEAAPTVMIRWPARIGSSSEEGGPISLLDLAPTALGLAGLSAPAYMEGRSLVRSDESVAAGRPARAVPPRAADAAADEVRIRGLAGAAASVPLQAEAPVAATPAGYPTGGLFHVAPVVELACATEGSTIVYTTEHETPFYWRLYTGPFRMRFWTLRFQCGRLGYRDSDIVTYDFDIE